MVAFSFATAIATIFALRLVFQYATTFKKEITYLILLYSTLELRAVNIVQVCSLFRKIGGLMVVSRFGIIYTWIPVWRNQWTPIERSSANEFYRRFALKEANLANRREKLSASKYFQSLLFWLSSSKFSEMFWLLSKFYFPVACNATTWLAVVILSWKQKLLPQWKPFNVTMVYIRVYMTSCFVWPFWYDPIFFNLKSLIIVVSVMATIRVLWTKYHDPKAVILSGIHCIRWHLAMNITLRVLAEVTVNYNTVN